MAVVRRQHVLLDLGVFRQTVDRELQRVWKKCFFTSFELMSWCLLRYSLTSFEVVPWPHLK